MGRCCRSSDMEHQPDDGRAAGRRAAAAESAFGPVPGRAPGHRGPRARGPRCGGAARRIVRPLLLSALLACGRTSGSSHAGLRQVQIDLDKAGRAAQGSRRQADGNQLRCLTATVERPTIGQCIDVFSKPVQLRTCVRNTTEAQARVDLPIVGPRVRWEWRRAVLLRSRERLRLESAAGAFLLTEVRPNKQASHRRPVAVCQPGASLHEPAVPPAMARLGGAPGICIHLLRRNEGDANLQRFRRLLHLHAWYMYPTQRSSRLADRLVGARRSSSIWR